MMDFVALQATLRPSKLAITDLTFQRRWTYCELNRWINQVATYLLNKHIQVGDRVACLSKNRAEIIALNLACARIGAIFVPLNWRLTHEEIGHLIADCQPVAIFGDSLLTAAVNNAIDIETLFADTRGLAPWAGQPDPSMPSLILYTSGTTGKPKGIVHTELSLWETMVNMTLLGQVDEHSVFLCETPMFHVIGLISCVRPALFSGGGLVISDGFDAARTLSRLASPDLAVSHYFCVPQMANMLRQHPDFDSALLTRMKGILTGGAPHPEVQIRAWLADGIPIVDGYGMSEAGTVLGMPFDIPSIDKNAGCVGVSTSRVSLRLVDDYGHDVADGVPGEVLVKGQNLFCDIWGQPEVYAACFRDGGWFQTGDIAVRNEAGFYRIVDRKKDMFISGGENVYPVEVEGIVLTIPGIRECALIGLPDSQWGEVGCLFYVGDGSRTFTLDDINQVLTGHLARYKLPKRLVEVDSLPRNGAGKIMKHQLRDRIKS